MKKPPKIRTPKKMTDLKPANYNPRTISDEALAGLSFSLKTFGDLSGIVWNLRTGNLVAGHQRVKELAKAGAEIDEYGLIEHPNGERFPVRVVDWDVDKEKVANVTANNALISGEFTPDLEPMLGELEGFEGYTDLRLDELKKEFGKGIVAEEKAEVEFSARLDEESNYLVLYFDSETDWLQALTLFDVKPANASWPNGKKYTTGVGRVIDGPKAIERMMKD